MPDDYHVLPYSGEEIEDLLGKAGSATGAVRYDAAQTLTDAQKKQARANIAAAPDGFGLGANGYPNPYTVVTGATIDTLNESGLFWFEDGDTPIYPDGYNSGTVGNLLHIHGDETHTLAARQIFYPYNPYGDGGALNISCMRMKTGAGEWQPWEWVNPPMQFGVEYRTTERYLGKPVYTTIVNCGTITAGTNTIAHNIASVAQMVGCEFIDVSGYIAGQPPTLFVTANVSSIYIDVTGDQFVGRTIYVRLRYVKSTN